MNTPICDFVNEYINKNAVRLHMPGHKGKALLGFEEFDITEISGADSLYEAEGIIKESEQNASKLFGCDTFYSTEGSSHCIRTMLYLSMLYGKEQGKSPKILAGRNAHKTFVSAAALLDINVVWIESDTENSYLSCNISAEKLETLILKEKPFAVYLTSPDYLGNMTDIKALSAVCKKYGVLLLVDNAHGAYLKFLSESLHPIDLGADLCADSAHKTLPVLTGGAYLHIGPDMSEALSPMAKNALALFGSTSPSYLILQSMDRANKYIFEEFTESLKSFLPLVNNLKNKLTTHGYKLIEQETLKITLSTKDYGYKGNDFAEILTQKGFVCEFSDPDYVVLMLSPALEVKDLLMLQEALLSITPLTPIKETPPTAHIPKKAMSVRQASLSPMETIPVKESEGRTLAAATVGCPPAVPIIVCGEIIDKRTIAVFEYYNIKDCTVIKTSR
ncbi:MAG: aminotransferase class V-fold PLP-dependent enzyme [Ruminococcaceae bacterium]|nr:aminotransferase class V-fold PLP-dependent enzyme [Oscillospiraceae bacterium]